jgi:hypothetical protein
MLTVVIVFPFVTPGVAGVCYYTYIEPENSMLHLIAIFILIILFVHFPREGKLLLLGAIELFSLMLLAGGLMESSGGYEVLLTFLGVVCLVCPYLMWKVISPGTAPTHPELPVLSEEL